MTTLLLASTGGHLAELHQLAPRLLRPDERAVWVTFDSPQSRSLLAGEEVVWVPDVAPRDYAGVLRAVPHAWRILHDVRADRIISTGSAVALSFLPLARFLGIPCHYIESAARTDSPSLTGRLLEHVPGVELTSQYEHWDSVAWRPGPSVFDGFRPLHVEPVQPLRRLLVTVGTMEFAFPRLLRRLLDQLPPDVEVVWQTGHTPVGGLPLVSTPFLDHAALVREMAAADVVVSHAGIGSALAALRCGQCPVLVPRRARHGEHVDDHQTLIARELALRGLAVTVEADGLTRDSLERARRVRVLQDPVTPVPGVRTPVGG